MLPAAGECGSGEHKVRFPFLQQIVEDHCSGGRTVPSHLWQMEKDGKDGKEGLFIVFPLVLLVQSVSLVRSHADFVLQLTPGIAELLPSALLTSFQPARNDPNGAEGKGWWYFWSGSC